jgi:hypothetical protein
MEFGIGFVIGGVSTGVTVAHWDSIAKTLQLWVAKAQSALQRKVAGKVAALRAKL